MSVNLTTGTAVGHGLDAIATTENVIGSNQPDTLVGNAQNNVIQGRFGIDRMWGLGGHDLMLGGAHNDRYDGGTGHRHRLLRGVACSGEREPHRR